MKSYLFVLTILLWIIFPASIEAQQINIPEPSPAYVSVQKMGLSDVRIEYSRPSIRDREIFGELVPYNQIWRTGANNATTVTFSTDITVEGKPLEKGKYGILTIPGKEHWTIILTKNTDLWGAIGYNESDDALRFKVDALQINDRLETLFIGLEDLTESWAHLVIKWDFTSVKFRIEAEVEPIVMKQIQNFLIDQESSNPDDLYNGASYYYTKNFDLNKALAWITKAVDISPEYWMIHLKAKIELGLDKKDEAMSTAVWALEEAKKAKNWDYVTLNQNLINSIK